MLHRRILTLLVLLVFTLQHKVLDDNRTLHHIHFMMQSTLIDNDTTPPATRAAARAALGSALVLGFAAERLLYYGPTGPGFVIWIALFGLCAFMIVRQAGFAWQRETAIA